MTESDLHNLRLEFVKRVLSSNLIESGSQQSDENDIDRFDGQDATRHQLKLLMTALDSLPSEQVFLVYKQLSTDLKLKLKQLGLLSDTQQQD